MTAPVALFACSICGETSKDICVLCTKDACANHRCERCKRCSDCCECDVPLSAEEVIVAAETPLPAEETPVIAETPPEVLPESIPEQTAATGEIPPYLPESFEIPRDPGE